MSATQPQTFAADRDGLAVVLAGLGLCAAGQGYLGTADLILEGLASAGVVVVPFREGQPVQYRLGPVGTWRDGWFVSLAEGQPGMARVCPAGLPREPENSVTVRAACIQAAGVAR